MESQTDQSESLAANGIIEKVFLQVFSFENDWQITVLFSVTPPSIRQNLSGAMSRLVVNGITTDC